LNLQQVDALREIIKRTEVFEIWKCGVRYKCRCRSDEGIEFLEIKESGKVKRTEMLRFTPIV